MEISDIKNRLTINQVLNHYGLKPDKNHRINCPFHEDKTPLMQVYPETNTVFCFSSNCKLNGKAIDQIDFIMHKESCTKHEAINKARILSGEYPKSKTITINKNMIEKPENAGRIAVLTKLMYEAKESLIRSAKAQ